MNLKVSTHKEEKINGQSSIRLNFISDLKQKINSK